MGYLLAAAAVGLLIWFGWVLLSRIGTSEDDRWRIRVQLEQVDLIEGASIVEQHKSGREQWRWADVKLPERELTYRERLALDRIQGSKDQQVRIRGQVPARPEPTTHTIRKY